MELLSLAGSWTLKPREGQVLPVETIEQKRLGSVPAEIPGDIMSALLSAGLISDPYSGTNELGIQWVGETDWILGRDFNVSSSLFACKRIFLAIDLLDTVAEVYINGRLAGKNDNMFVPCRWDVQDYLREGRNHIEAIIFSPVKAAAKKAATLPYPVPESVYPVSSPHRNLLRKAQCMSGWDWGPCLMTGGIYDGIALCGIDGPRIESVQTRMKAVQPGTDGDFQWPATADAFASQTLDQASDKKPEYSRPDFAVTVTVEANSTEATDAVLGISLAGSSVERHIQLPAGDSIAVERFMVSQPELWWPAESGKQSLYELVVRLGPGGTAPCGPLGAQAQCHEERKRIGFRELRVSTEKDSAGREMSFAVNGRRVFAKGANWVPADALPSRWTKARLSRLLQDATQAHMNCLRVWGG
ncbi:MAG: hypothetical protein LLF89_01590, partial [Spirochaetaceae bacterium]|nr:hypothetical protein [Spirochaetaceae bacterium]